MFSEGVFEFCEVAHADGEVTGFEDLLAEDVFEDVFEGDEAGGGAEFVDGDSELLVVFEECLEGVCGGGGFGDEVNGLHEVVDAGVLFGIDHVFAADDTDDVIDIAFVDGEAREGNGGVDIKDFFESEFLIEGGYYLARGFEFCDGDVVEGEGIGDHVTFVICKSAFLGTFFGEEDDFIIVVILGFINGVDEELDGFFADERDGAHEDANEVHRVDAGTEDLAAVEEADIFG